MRSPSQRLNRLQTTSGIFSSVSSEAATSWLVLRLAPPFSPHCYPSPVQSPMSALTRPPDIERLRRLAPLQWMTLTTAERGPRPLRDGHPCQVFFLSVKHDSGGTPHIRTSTNHFALPATYYRKLSCLATGPTRGRHRRCSLRACHASQPP